MKLYSPDLLRLKAQTTVQTLDGVYTSQIDEVWHSHSQYMDRVREGLSK
jgi:preprotein translocase subunit SecA